jgi:hypothetical protein
MTIYSVYANPVKFDEGTKPTFWCDKTLFYPLIGTFVYPVVESSTERSYPFGC